MLVKNSSKTTNLVYASSSFSFDPEASSCVIVDSAYVDEDHQNITLKNITSGESFTIRINTVEIPTSYYLIDKAGKQIFGPKESTSALMEIPSEWSSPLATYHYWRSTSFEENSGTYTLREGQVELNGLADLGAGEHIFITYDVKDDIDLDGRDLLNNRGGALGATYRLKFTGGQTFNQETAKEWAELSEATFICGHFEGIDERVLEKWQVQEISLGDFVLSGGEVALMAMLDATIRLIPGVLGNAESIMEESFSNNLLEYPQYTKPQNWQGRAVPEVLLSGNHAKIAAWRKEQSENLTKTRRPDLYEKYLAQK